MAENIQLNLGAGGDVLAADEISGVAHQRVKVQHGADGTATDVSSDSPMPVSLENGPFSAFGELLTVEPEPQVQRKFALGLNDYLDKAIEHDGGTVTTSGGELLVGTSTTTSSMAVYLTTRITKYDPGQGVEAKFTARFTSPVAGTVQLIGIGSAEDGLFFGYNGTSFGVMRRSGGAVETRTLEITGEPTGDGNITVTLNGGSVAVAILNADTIGDVCRKIAAADVSTIGGGWVSRDAGNRVVFSAIKTDTRGGSYSFVDTDTTGVTATGPTQTLASSASTDTWTAQTAWSIDKAAGAERLPVMDWTKGNVFKITFQWLGYGAMLFEVERPSTGMFLDVHRIEYANANTSPSMRNPDLVICASADNGATSSDMVVRSSSLASFTHGKRNIRPGVRLAVGNEVSVTTTLANVITIRAKSVFSGVTNRARVLVDEIAMGNNGTKTCKFVVTKNPSLVGSPSWTDADTSNSTIEYDTTATAITGGEELFGFIIGSTDGQARELNDRRSVELAPGDMLVIQAAQQGGGGSADVEGSLGWTEEF